MVPDHPGGSPPGRASGPEDIVSFLGRRLDTRRLERVRSTIWPLLIVAGLLTVPAECARIGHPHSLFQGASAAPAPSQTQADGAPHSAADHAHAGSAYLPAWASPSGAIAPPIEPPVAASRQHPAHPNTSRLTIPAAPLMLSADALPVVEPAARTAIAAFGTTLALIAALAVVLVPGTARATGMIAPLSGLLARSLDPPPPRRMVVAC